MLNEEALEQINRALQRIFSMTVTRTTYREVQNVVMTVTKNQQEDADKLFQALMTGNANEDLTTGKGLQKLNQIMDQYSVPIRLARDVMERGEFINLLTSDSLNSGDRILFLNRIRRVDGDEFQFVTDAASTVHILQHFMGRIHELLESDKGKKTVEELGPQIAALQKQLNDVADATT